MKLTTLDECMALLEWGVGSLPSPTSSLSAGDGEQLVGALRFSDTDSVVVGSTGLAVYDGVLTMQPTLGAIDIGSTNIVTLTRLHDILSGNYPDDLTVVFSIETAFGVPIVGASNIPMPVVPGTSGAGTVYRGVIPIPITHQSAPGSRWVVIATATDAAGNIGEFALEVTLLRR